MDGADIYARYQQVTDWRALADDTTFLWIKGTDGAGRAPVPADAYVRQAQAHGIPIGLYHFAQLVPRPEAQADILAREVQRLGADQVAPALDIEHPHKPGPTAREFVERFLRRLATHFPRVAIYGNASMFAAIRPDTLDIGADLVIWCAHYGPNDGKRHHRFAPYTGRVDVHQYTDRGRIDGIAGAVDLNHAHRSPLMKDTDDMTPEALVAALIDHLRNNPAARKVIGQAVWEFRTSGRKVQAQDRLTGVDDHRIPALAAAVSRIEAGLVLMREMYNAMLNTPNSTPEQLDATMARAVTTGFMPVLTDTAARVGGTDEPAVAALLAELGTIVHGGDAAIPAPALPDTPSGEDITDDDPDVDPPPAAVSSVLPGLHDRGDA